MFVKLFGTCSQPLTIHAQPRQSADTAAASTTGVTGPAASRASPFLGRSEAIPRQSRAGHDDAITRHHYKPLYAICFNILAWVDDDQCVWGLGICFNFFQPRNSSEAIDTAVESVHIYVRLFGNHWKPSQSRQSADTAAAFTSGGVARFLGWSGAMPERPEPGHDDTIICLFGALVFVSASVNHALRIYSYRDQAIGYHSKPFDTVRQSARSADRVAPFLGQMRVYLDNSLDMMKPW